MKVCGERHEYNHLLNPTVPDIVSFKIKIDVVQRFDYYFSCLVTLRPQ
jgi:hypothetical protein